MSSFYYGANCAIPSPWLTKTLGKVTGENIHVSVIDSGWDTTLIDKRIRKGIGVIDPKKKFNLYISDNYHDLIGHGTICADLILRIAPAAHILPIKVFGEVLETSTRILIKAINLAVSNKVKVINISMGTILDDQVSELYKACEIAKRKGIIIVSAKANNHNWSYPAIFDNVIGVSSAMLPNNYWYMFSKNEGIECTANGCIKDACGLMGKRVSVKGSSFAAANICGIVSLFLEKYPDSNIDDVRDLLEMFSLNKNQDAMLQTNLE